MDVNTTQGISYDNYGRMNYHPEIHINHCKSWTTTDQNYLIQFYDQIGPEQMSFELGRTICTVMDRASTLREKGLMATPTTRTHHRRMKAATNKTEASS